MCRTKVKFFSFDPQKEAEYLCFLAKDLEKEYYQKGDFFILPYQATKIQNSLYFPDFPYSSNFWRKIRYCRNENFGSLFPPSAVTEIKNFLQNQKPDLSAADKIVANWQEKEGNFFEICRKFLDFILSEIEVLITNYGTPGSFFSKKISSDIKIEATNRTDFTASNIAKTILLAHYRSQSRKTAEVGENTWGDRQAAVNFLLSQTAFKQLFPDLVLSPRPNTKIEKLQNDSRNYLAKLGYPTNPIIIRNKIAIGRFTAQEKLLLEFLIRNKNSLVTFDQAAEIIWAEKVTDKFSLYSLAKVIENIRKKLLGCGINKDILHTVRSQGYILFE